MPTTKNLMGAGLVPLQATSILGSVANGLTATGVGQSDALALTSDLNVFSTVATGTGTRLQANLARGDEITVANNGANALLVYPPTGAAIGTAAANDVQRRPYALAISALYARLLRHCCRCR